MPRVSHLLSRATLLPRTQLSCSWTHSAVLCKSAARPAVGGGLGLLWLASELRLSDVMDGCCLCGGGAGGRGGGPGWLDRWSPAKKQRGKLGWYQTCSAFETGAAGVARHRGGMTTAATTNSMRATRKANATKSGIKMRWTTAKRRRIRSAFIPKRTIIFAKTSDSWQLGSLKQKVTRKGSCSFMGT